MDAVSDAEPGEVAMLGLFVLLQILGETRVALGLDGDSSEVFDRAGQICGAFAAIAAVAGAKGGAVPRALRRRLAAAEPLVTRLAETGVMPRTA